MINLFLDANVIIKHEYLLLDSNLFILFKRYVKERKDDVKLYLPQVVIAEVCKKFLEVSGKPLTVGLIRKLTQDKYTCESDVSRWYEGFLLKELDSIGAIVVKYPDVRHEEIISRYMSGRRPFSKQGDLKGYKDCLLWHSIIEVLKSDKGASKNKHILITNDSDFIYHHKEKETDCLHDELASEVKGLGVGDFEVVSDLKQFVKKYIEPAKIDIISGKEKEILDFLDSKADVVCEKLGEAVRKDKESVQLLYTYGIIPTEIENYNVDGIYLSEIHISDEYSLDDEKYLFQVQVLSEANVEGFLFRGDCEDDWKVYDYDWNEWYMRVGKTIALSVEASIVYDKGKNMFLADTLQIENVEHW